MRTGAAHIERLRVELLALALALALACEIGRDVDRDAHRGAPRRPAEAKAVSKFPQPEDWKLGGRAGDRTPDL